MSDEKARAFDPLKAKHLGMRLFVRCDLPGRAYKVSDFEDALEQHGLDKDMVAMGGPVPACNDWVLKPRTYDALKILENDHRITVKGQSCTVIITEARQVSIGLHWVPLDLTNAAIRKVFQNDSEENHKVPVEPAGEQVAFTAECDSEKQSVSNQETEPVAEEAPAEEPGEAFVPDAETGQTSGGDQNDSSEDSKAMPTSCP
ncbi:hypothetical protein MTO96_028628 [Rhipicephalus appendiculatus]